jgi:type II secretory pathway pseudopilin PulG
MTAKTARTPGAATNRSGARRSPLANEDGMLLVITMVILLVVSTLAAANLINAFLERSLAQNQNNASVALNAADGGIQEGLAWLNDDANLPTIPTAASSWARPGDPVTRTGLSSGASYTLSLAFKRDAEDQDCDGDTDDIVIFNKGGVAAACPHDGLFPFPGALFSGAPGDVGYPVISINAKGYLGTLAANRGYREIEMDVARNKFAAQVEGAFTARAGVTATGNSRTDGRNHDLSGDLTIGGGVGCMADKPGITYDEGIAPAETCPNTNIKGSPCVANHDPTAPWKRPLEKTPWGVLGISEADFNAEFVKKTNSQMDMTECYPDKHNVWFAGTGGARFNNLSPCTHYGGVLVIHNEGFDPDWWEANCTSTPLTGACADPTKQPAVFDMNGNVQWTGVIIADQVVRVNGTPTILGGIISLASGGVIDSDITGTITIQYSCEAVMGAINQGYKTRLGWHRLR